MVVALRLALFASLSAAAAAAGKLEVLRAALLVSAGCVRVDAQRRPGPGGRRPRRPANQAVARRVQTPGPGRQDLMSSVDVHTPSPEECVRLTKSVPTPEDYRKQLDKEVVMYEKSPKFRNKILELHAPENIDWLRGRIGEIATALGRIITKETTSILDLGCASGLITLRAQTLAPPGARVVGVELVPGWIAAAQEWAEKNRIPNTEFVVGDATAVHLNRTFDTIFMADAYEHIPVYRRAHLWSVLREHAHKGTELYIHVPTESKQQEQYDAIAKKNLDKQQHFDEIIEYQGLASLAACHGFTLVDLVEPTELYVSAFFRYTHDP